MDDAYYESKKEAARSMYAAQPLIHSPFFDEDIVLGAEGFRHLLLSAHGERTKAEQIQRFMLLPIGIQVLKTATTLQTYRRQLNGGRRNGWVTVQWWSFVALFVKQDVKVRVLVRKLGDDRLHFWGVMLDTKRNRRMESKLVA